MAYDEVSRNATNKYREKFDMIQFKVPKGERQVIADHAAAKGESINAFVNRAVKETMDRDRSSVDEGKE